MAEFFAYAVDKRLALFWLPFGLRPSKDGITITDAGTFLATYGFLRLQTPLPISMRSTLPAITGGGRRRAPGRHSPMTA
jgi:hypothetical protein